MDTDNIDPLVQELQELYSALSAEGYPWVAYCPTVYKAVQTIERQADLSSNSAPRVCTYMNEPQCDCCHEVHAVRSENLRLAGEVVRLRTIAAPFLAKDDPDEVLLDWDSPVVPCTSET